MTRTSRAIAPLALLTLTACSPSRPSAVLAVSCAQTTVSVYSAAGSATQCKAALNGSDVTQTAQWSSSNAVVATVSSGFVQARAVGSAQITATAQGASANQIVTVNDAFPVSVSSASKFAVQGATPVRLLIENGGPGAVHPALSVNWGDGQTSAVPADSSSETGCNMIDSCVVFQHVYSAAGSFTSTVTALSGSQPSLAYVTFTIKSMTGTWTNTYQNPSTGQETRLLTLSGGATLTGSYTHPAGNSEPLGGSVDAGGLVHLRLNSGTIAWDSGGLSAPGINSDVTAFTVVETGGSADGVTLTFTRQQ